MYSIAAVGAAIGLALIGESAASGLGVVTPEALNPARAWKEWSARHWPLACSEWAAAT